MLKLDLDKDARIVLIGDLHFGEKNNSADFNKQIINYLQTQIIDKYKDENVVIIQAGDWFHQRNRLQVDTLNYGIIGADMLGKAFGRENVLVLAGNHDMFYENRLDVSSLLAISEYVTVIDEVTLLQSHSIVLTPWIVNEDQWQEVCKLSEQFDYVVGHFELSSFRMNENYVMEHGYNPSGLKGYKRVFSGHYHTKQERDNIVYLGTPYPITLNEANGEHGDWYFDHITNELTFNHYDEIAVLSIPYTEINNIEKYTKADKSNITLRVEFPSDIGDESIITDTMVLLNNSGYNSVRQQYRKEAVNEIMENDIQIEHLDRIDDVIIDAIDNIKMDVDNNLLKELYNLSRENNNE